MPDVVRQVETQFTVMDKATAPIRRMQAAATRLTTLFDRASGVLGKFGGIAAAAAGGFAVSTSIMGANQYLRTVRDIGDATGYAASEVDGILEAMQKVNIGATEAQNAITVMAVKQARVRMEIERTGKAQSDSARIIQAMGVTAEMGPEESFRRMASLAQQQKLTLSDLVIGFEMERTVAAKLIRLLQQGPAAITATMDSLRDRGIDVTARNVEAFAKFEQAQIAIKSAWDRIFIVVANRVYPVITDMMEKVAARLDAWSVKAGEWGAMLAGWLEKHHQKLILIGKVMLANFAMQKTMGFGVAGAARRAGAFGMGFMQRGAEAASKAHAARYAAAWRSQRADMVSPAEFAPSVMQKLVGGFRTLNPLMVALYGAAAMAALAIRGFNRNVGGLRDSITRLFARISAQFQPITNAVERIEGADPGGIFSMIADVLGEVLLKPIELLLWYTDQFVLMVRTIGGVIGSYPNILRSIWDTIANAHVWLGVKIYNLMVELVNKVTGLVGGPQLERRALPQVRETEGAMSRYLRIWNELNREAEAAARLAAQRRKEAEVPRPGGRPPAERERQPYNDFRGSRFDIKQSFAEGFDPDRIAVAFTNDLATLGERRVQSAFAPVGVVR